MHTTHTKRLQSGNVIIISITHFLHDVYTSFLAPVLPLLIEKLSLSYTLAGILSLVQRLPSVFNPFVGLLADRVSLRYFVIICPAVTSVSMSLLGVAPHYVVLIILLAVAGVSSAFFHVPAPVMVKKVSGNKIGMGMSFFMLGGELARTTGPLIILGAVSIWGFEGSYKLIPFGLLASFLVYLRLRNIKVYKELQKKQKNGNALVTLRRHLRYFVGLTGFVLFTAFMKSTIAIFLPTFFNEQGETLWSGGIHLAIYQLAGSVGIFASGSISDIIGRKNTLLISSVLNPVFMWLFISFHTTIVAVPMLILLGFSLISAGSVLLATVQDIQSEHPAFLTGMYMAVNFALGALVVTITGAISDLTSMTIAYKITATLGVLAIPFAFLIHNRR